MPEIIIYTTASCPYCYRAKALLSEKNAAFVEIPVDGKSALRQEMSAKAGGSLTVPQIFIAGRHVGGCDDLYALNSAGELDALLAS